MKAPYIYHLALLVRKEKTPPFIVNLMRMRVLPVSSSAALQARA